MKIKESSRILVVDNDLAFLELLGPYLNQRGYIAQCFTNPEEAIITIESHKFDPQLILCDLKLSQMTAQEFIILLNRKGIRVPVIVMTSEGSLQVASEILNHGAEDFLLKPLNFSQLLISIHRCLYVNKTSIFSTGHENVDSELPGIIGRSESFCRAIDLAKRVANTTSNILINGESGSGKEIIARAIHHFGNNRQGPFVAINCSAIPENLLESELFGHAKGSFTGAVDKKTGLFEEANKGTLFLDEIGDLGLSLQSKLLRVLQERKIKRIGENQYRDISARIICATHKDLKKEVKEGKFREDLYFRLNVIPIAMPPLRMRREDILPLAEFFLKKYSLLNHKLIKGFEIGAAKKLELHSWRGNVRELENTIERAVVLANSDQIGEEDFNLEDSEQEMKQKELGKMQSFDETLSQKMSLDELSKKYIRFIYDKNQGAKEQTARDLGIDRKTLYRKLKEINVEGV